MKRKNKLLVKEGGGVFKDFFSSITLSFCVTSDHCLMLCAPLMLTGCLYINMNEQEFHFVVLVKYP